LVRRSDDNDTSFLEHLERKALWVRRETLRIHKFAPETRVASSLSDIEILVALYYGGILNFDPHSLDWDGRDRFVVSKGHGAVSLYPILADLGFFEPDHLARVCRADSFLGAIPDALIPGIETTNGSLGHGLGVACGMSFALRRKKSDSSVFVLVGDGELYEGAVWEAVMFAGHHRLSNLILIVDSNRISMLDYCDRILKLTPLEEKFRAFGWEVASVDGHNVSEVYSCLHGMKAGRTQRPRAMVANTVKGKGVPALEQDRLCHIRSLKDEEVTAAIEALQ
jgi:transketolase